MLKLKATVEAIPMITCQGLGFFLFELDGFGAMIVNSKREVVVTS
jgi:hypothetical protein